MSLRLRFENLYLFVMFQSDDLGVHILDLIFRLVEAVSEAPLPHPYPLAVQTIVAELGTDILIPAARHDAAISPTALAGKRYVATTRRSSAGIAALFVFERCVHVRMRLCAGSVVLWLVDLQT
jgi:hypothetical protein